MLAVIFDKGFVLILENDQIFVKCDLNWCILSSANFLSDNHRIRTNTQKVEKELKNRTLTLYKAKTLHPLKKISLKKYFDALSSTFSVQPHPQPRAKD